MRRTSQSATIGASSPGSFPWRTDSLRLGAADAARNHTTPSGSTVSDDQTFYTDVDLPGTGGRLRVMAEGDSQLMDA